MNNNITTTTTTVNYENYAKRRMHLINLLCGEDIKGYAVPVNNNNIASDEEVYYLDPDEII